MQTWTFRGLIGDALSLCVGPRAPNQKLDLATMSAPADGGLTCGLGWDPDDVTIGS